jgi:hypothetical protein
VVYRTVVCGSQAAEVHVPLLGFDAHEVTVQLDHKGLGGQANGVVAWRPEKGAGSGDVMVVSVTPGAYAFSSVRINDTALLRRETDETTSKPSW